MMTFKGWLDHISKEGLFTDVYQQFADTVLEDNNFPDTQIKAQNRRYLRINAGYVGRIELTLFDDLWTEYEKECLPKKTAEWKERNRKVRQAEREDVCNKIMEYIADNRTGLYDGFCDKLTDYIEKLVIEGAQG